MLKKCTIVLIAIATTVRLFAMEPYVKTVEEHLERDGIKYVQTERNIYFKNGTIRYLTLNEDGKKELTKKKWGDYFMGLEFGRPRSSNGGWDLWNFFECTVKMEGKYKHVSQMFLPENVYVTQLNGVTMAEIISPLSIDGTAGKMSMQIMQFLSHKDWLFIRIKFIDSTIAPWRMRFSAYPGNSNNPKERERWIATKENRYCISRDGVTFIPESNAMMIYSRFVHDRFGNFIIFDSTDFQQIKLPKSGAGVTSYFFPKDGGQEFEFAISYFMDKSAEDELSRFLGETQDNIHKFMKSIDWRPEIDGSEFDKLLALTATLIKEIKEVGVDGKQYELELMKIRHGFADAEKEGNMSEVVSMIGQMKDLRKRVAEAGLAVFK